MMGARWEAFKARLRREPGDRKRLAGPYKAGRIDRRLSGWSASNADANRALGQDLATMRARSLDAERNDRWAHAASLRLTTYLAGIRPQSAIVEGPGMTAERAAALNRQIDQVWKAWELEAQTDGDLTLRGLQVRAIKGMIDSGDSLARLRARRLEDGLTVPLQVEILEGHHLDHTLSEDLANGGRIVQGVEFDAINRRVAYHLHRRHPGDASPWGVGGVDRVRVPASEIVHLYPAPLTRPGQVRGAPWFHAILQDLRDFSGYQDATRVQQRAAAAYMAIVKQREDDPYAGEDDLPVGMNPVRDDTGEIVESLQPGTIGYVYGDAEVTFNTPPKAEGYGPFTQTELRGIAAGMGLPYEILTGDLSQTSYSSLIFGIGPFQALMDLIREEVVIPLWAARIWKAWTAAGIAAGALPPEAGPVSWTAPPYPLVDPERQNKADAIAIRGGWLPLDEKIRRTGADPETVLASYERLQRWARDHGVVLDTDPAMTTQNGQRQADAGADAAVDAPAGDPVEVEA